MKLVKLSAMLSCVFFVSLQCEAQCSNVSLNGVLYYSTSGTVKTGTGTATASYSELAKLTADGKGNLSGQTTTSTAGVIATLPVSGSYSIQANCSGTATLTTSANSAQVALQIVNGGGLTLGSITSSTLGELSEARFYRAANATGSQCGNGSLMGAYGLLLTGGTYVSATRTEYENASQLVFDGKGGITVTGEITTPSASGTPSNGTGTYTIAADCSGTAQVITTSGASNYLLARIEGGTVLFQENDANTTIIGSANVQAIQEVLPQFVFGGGWYSALYFTNSTSVTVTFLVTFTGDNGGPMAVPGVGSSQQVTLQPLGTTIIEALNVGSLIQGYASFALPAGVTGYGVFRQSVSGRPDQEALVGFKLANATAVSLTFDDTNFTTSVAIVNPSNVVATVTMTAWDSNGNALGTSTQPLMPGNKIEGALRGFLGLAGIAGFRGSALLTVPAGSVEVLGLRFGGSAFTSIPTTEEQ